MSEALDTNDDMKGRGRGPAWTTMRTTDRSSLPDEEGEEQEEAAKGQQRRRPPTSNVVSPAEDAVGCESSSLTSGDTGTSPPSSARPTGLLPCQDPDCPPRHRDTDETCIDDTLGGEYHYFACHDDDYNMGDDALELRECHDTGQEEEEHSLAPLGSGEAYCDRSSSCPSMRWASSSSSFSQSSLLAPAVVSHSSMAHQQQQRGGEELDLDFSSCGETGTAAATTPTEMGTSVTTGSCVESYHGGTRTRNDIRVKEDGRARAAGKDVGDGSNNPNIKTVLVGDNPVPRNVRYRSLWWWWWRVRVMRKRRRRRQQLLLGRGPGGSYSGGSLRHEDIAILSREEESSALMRIPGCTSETSWKKGTGGRLRRYPLLRGALWGAFLSFLLLLVISTLDEAHGGAHCTAVPSSSSSSPLVVAFHGVALTLGRMVADAFPSCTLRDARSLDEKWGSPSVSATLHNNGDGTTTCWIRPVMRLLEALERWNEALFSLSYYYTDEALAGDEVEEEEWEYSRQGSSITSSLGDVINDRSAGTHEGGVGRRRNLLRRSAGGWNWFRRRRRRSLATTKTTDEPLQHQRQPHKRRRMADADDLPTSTYLVVAGQMVVEEGECNIAQLDLNTDEWSLQQRIQLSLYNSYSGGEVYSLLSNKSRTVAPPSSSSSRGGSGGGGVRSVTANNQRPTGGGSISTTTNNDDDTSAGGGGGGSSSLVDSGGGGGSDSGGGGGRSPPFPQDVPISVDDMEYGELIVVGAFDTTYRNSQVTYCSVGRWDGTMLNKMGEGLCNSALSKGMKITSAAFAGPHDIYVAGSFHTQVWNGDRREFVKIFNIAHFNAIEQVWLPLVVGQLTCSWCIVTVLALAWDSKRRQLHVAGKFNAIENRNVPAGLAVYNTDSGHLVAHPGGGLTFANITEDGVGTALQMDEESGVLYVMGSFERLSMTKEKCLGLAAYEVDKHRWTCLADPKHTVEPTGGGNMLLTPYGLMVAGKVQGDKTTWPNPDRPYTIALLTTTLKSDYSGGGDSKTNSTTREFVWNWLPGFDGHEDPIHCLSNGYNEYAGTVFIGGDNFVAKWSYEEMDDDGGDGFLSGELGNALLGGPITQPRPRQRVPVTTNLGAPKVRGSVMAISQLVPPPPERPMSAGDDTYERTSVIGYTILVYSIALGAVVGMLLALLCNKNLNATIANYLFSRDAQVGGFSLDTLTYSAMENTNVAEAYQRAMKTRFVDKPNLLTMINPKEILCHEVIGQGTFGRVWRSKWRNSSVAVKEFVFAQAAVAGNSTMHREIIDEIIGEAGMMSILRNPNVLQLYGCCLTSQAIWIVSELCSCGSLRQVLDDPERDLPLDVRLSLALNVVDGMSYLHEQDPAIIHRDLKSHNIFVHETFSADEVQRQQESEARKKRRKSRQKKKKGNGTGETPVSNGGGGLLGGAKRKSGSALVAKIGDWGNARAQVAGSRTMTAGVGTACWLAPEVIKHARYSQKSDVYGFGVILWELGTREEVYKGLETMQIIAQVANENLRPPLPERCLWQNLMVQCWHENPDERPSFAEIGTELNRMLSWARSRADSDMSSDSSYHESYQGNTL